MFPVTSFAQSIVLLQDVLGNPRCAELFWALTAINIMADVGVNCPREAWHFEGYRSYFDVLTALATDTYKPSSSRANAGSLNKIFILLLLVCLFVYALILIT